MNGQLVEEQKDSQIKIQGLEEQVAALKLKAMDPSSYMEWEWEEILFWILSLENGRYKKYEAVLQQALSEEEVKGEYLGKVDASDVKGWGIKAFMDKKDLSKHIEDLVAQNKNQHVAKPAFSAFAPGAPGAAEQTEEGGVTALHH